MWMENTTEGQKHLTAKVAGADEHVIVPAKRDGVNGGVEVTKAFVEALKADPDAASYFKDGVLVVVDGPKAVPAVKTDDEKAAAEVEAALKRQAVDVAAIEKAAKDKPKK